MNLGKMVAVTTLIAITATPAIAQSVELQGCPSDRSKVGYLLMGRKELGRSPKGTTSYSRTGVTLFGDPVLGIFQDNTNTSWLHLRLSRSGTNYFGAMSKKYASAAERNSCGPGYDGCYMKMKDDGKIYSLHSFDFTKFSGRMEAEGEPDGDYLICFYR